MKAQEVHEFTRKKGFLFLCVLPFLALPTLHCQKKRIGEDQKKKEEEKEFFKRVDRAITKGAEWLLKRQRPDGSWGVHNYFLGKYTLGPTALALLTLIHCGKNPNSDELKRGFEYLLKGYPRLTYEVGLALMALEAKATPLDEWEELWKPLAKRKGRPEAIMRPKRYLTKKERAFAKMFADWLSVNSFMGAWRYKEYPKNGDHSNTQYALLGLRAAARMGIKVRPRVWYNSLVHFLHTQARKGPRVKLLLTDPRKGGRFKYGIKVMAHARGWGYPSGGPPGMATGSMTTAGIACLIICRDELLYKRTFFKAEKDGSKRAKLLGETKRAIYDGLAWMQKYFAVEFNPAVRANFQGKKRKGKKVNPVGKAHGGRTDYYYLYGLERAFVLSGTKIIGNHDWYREGAEFLLKKQRRDGHWNNEIGWRSNITATCFALLFLKRSTYPSPVTGAGR